jgi:hypothetical protein
MLCCSLCILYLYILFASLTENFETTVARVQAGQSFNNKFFPDIPWEGSIENAWPPLQRTELG